MSADHYMQRNIDAVTRLAGTALPEGSTAANRRVLAVTATSGAPTLATDGFSVEGAEKLIVKLKATTHDYSVTLYEWDASSEEWALNNVVGTQNVTAALGTLLFGAEVDGSHRAYLRCTAATGTGGLDAWARLIMRPTGA